MANHDPRLIGGALLLPFLAPSALAGDAAVLDVRYETATAGFLLTAEVKGASGPVFAVVASLEGSSEDPLETPIVAFGTLDPSGNGIAAVHFEQSLLAKLKDGGLLLRAGYLAGASIDFTEPAELMIGGDPPLGCELLDFDFTRGADDVMVGGQTIDQQWASMGMLVSANNNHPAHPNRAILFDTGNPTGGDFDLATPNPAAVGNTEPLGNALIIAENETGVFGPSGLVTVPDDEAFGGSLFFEFDEPVTLCSATLIDIDEAPGTELRLYRNGNFSVPDQTIPIASLGDGSVQTVTVFAPDVEMLEIFLRGSGGVPMLEIIACPRVVDFDESWTGVPLQMQAGEHITTQLAAFGVLVDAVNRFVGFGGEPEQNHPDKAILFDTANPTGNDPDLLAPNPAVPGNDKALGLVLIVAEDDIDANTDGLVDDPDDEQAGGEIRVRFDSSVLVESVTVQDVDGTEASFLRFFDEFNFEFATIPIPNGVDGNVQTLTVNVPGVHLAVLDLGGSGALAELLFCPDEPVEVNE